MFKSTKLLARKIRLDVDNIMVYEVFRSTYLKLTKINLKV